MERKVLAYLIDTGTKLASDGIRVAVSQSIRQKAKERLESPIPPEAVEQTDHTPIPEEMVATEAKVGTACLDCISDHLDTINGALSEAVRFARSGDMAEVKKRIRIARAEVNIGERIDLDPALLPALSREQRDIAHWVLPKFRELRHGFQSLESAESIEFASAKVAVLTDEFATKLQGCPRCREAKKIEKPTRKSEPCDEPECAEMQKLWNKVKV
jgi:hypothetical protein